ncbi:MAG: hypothetical protein U0414_16090 [Polyangiaceae bacterium]
MSTTEMDWVSTNGSAAKSGHSRAAVWRRGAAGVAAVVATLSSAAACVVHADAGGGSGGVYSYAYEPCTFDADCPGGTQCWVVDMAYDDGVVEDAMCTTSCVDDLDCPGDGICEYGGGDPPLCFQPCAGDYDCPGGFACVAEAYEVGGYPVCVPY